MRVLRRLVLVLLLIVVAVVAADRLAPRATARVLVGLERARAGLGAERITVDGIDIAYLAGGTGEPLLLVHGFAADKDHFTRIAAHLTPHYRVLVPDLPGFGESSRPAGASYAIAEQAERVRAFARALGIERVHLGGNSMGGFIVTQYALAHPDEVRSLWLLDAAGTRRAFESELSRTIQASGTNPLLVRTPDDLQRTMAFVMAHPPFMPTSVLRGVAERMAADHELHARIFTQVGPGYVTTVDDRLHQLGMPTLVVWGTADRALNPEATQVYAAAMPRVQVVRMDGVGHLPMLEAPAETAADYLRFRQSLSSGGAT